MLRMYVIIQKITVTGNLKVGFWTIIICFFIQMDNEYSFMFLHFCSKFSNIQSKWKYSLHLHIAQIDYPVD